ncbi:hypothetical protein conserved [Leishmania donovani]|uniref:Uncharacterized protein n=3 Tax=Leishmania donovani species complex TaxID=38574 RepID=A4HSZ3_LEIIN|nr:conserved hypothetical protein [Leishmania infantum JPCM5]TPP49734.1 hypothetical protein CGC20_19880 [Leishmania donovani]CAC9446786.1 hypothetical_protein_-_conserved [Leishmania infantum]CAJ1986202.1 hypothetical protein conserved [Leishmania donovani]CAM65536.1 conserved hypothetical protein [Leishmania infantum JPCM5]SUZ39150.1 hypothetical_protein_-_conserved [Leishmania infantum]|eukprot:XP_001463184.1 conserved hypothetical protein [Leishmania infantum JPCM5]
MLRYAPMRRCSAAAMQTLSSWLTDLAEESMAVPSATDAVLHTRQNDGQGPTRKTPAQLWRELEDAAAHANALRETDTLFSILRCLLLKQQYPTDVHAWARLAKQLLPYSGIEQRSVLHYPGRPDASYRRDGHPRGSSLANLSSSSDPVLTGADGGIGDDGASRRGGGGARRGGEHAVPYSLYPSRETLLLSGGVVPLSARVPFGDGRAIALFVRGFTRFVEGQLGVQPHTQLTSELLQVVKDVSDAVTEALAANADSLQLELLLPALLDYMELLHVLDLCTATATGRGPLAMKDERRAAAGATGRDDEPSGHGRSSPPRSSRPTRFLQNMANDLAQNVMAGAARGARVVLYYLSERFAAVVEAYQADAPATFTDKMYWAQQRYLLTLTRACMWSISQHYTPATTAALSAAPGSVASSPSPHVQGLRSTVAPTDLVATAPMNAHIQALYDHIDVLFQRNTHADNPLHLTDEEVAQLKEIHTAALLRALRIEEAAPDAYLRRALEVVDRVPASMAIEGELIAGKVRLLELDSDTVDEEGRAAIYDDLLTSLRSLVEMRPRFSRHDGAHHAAGGGAAAAASASTPADGGGGEEDEGDGEQLRLDAATQAILQRAHTDVITAFCAAHKEEWSNEAYNILVAHKYHGVKITNDLIRPVLEVFSRRGDCRVFSLVDLCVLYSNEPIDMHTIALLFRTCAAAGDHYRARTFLQLVNEIIHGFLVKCPASVKESLQELKLLDPPPRHLFVSTEDDLVQSALGEQQRTVRRLPTGS